MSFKVKHLIPIYQTLEDQKKQRKVLALDAQLSQTI